MPGYNQAGMRLGALISPVDAWHRHGACHGVFVVTTGVVPLVVGACILYVTATVLRAGTSSTCFESEE